MSVITIAVLADKYTVEGVLDHFQAAGFDYTDISVILKDQQLEQYPRIKGRNLLEELHLGELIGKKGGELAALLASIDLLKRLGLTKDQIRKYEQSLEEDKVVILIWSSHRVKEEVSAILYDHNAEHLETVGFSEHLAPPDYRGSYTVAQKISTKPKKRNK
jgi:hypothetical protein